MPCVPGGVLRTLALGVGVAAFCVVGGVSSDSPRDPAGPGGAPGNQRGASLTEPWLKLRGKWHLPSAGSKQVVDENTRE